MTTKPPPLPTHNFPPLLNPLLLHTARNNPVPHPPIWIMRQAGRYLPQYHVEKAHHDFFTCCRTPSIASNLTLQPIDEYSSYLDAAIIFSDILVIPQALGMEVLMDPGKGPVFTSPLRGDPNEDAQYYAILNKQVDVPKDLDYVLSALTLTRHKLAGRVPLFGFSGAPFTLLSYMVEGGGSKLFFHIKTLIYTHPAAAHALLAKITQVTIEYLAHQVLAGAQILQVFDSWAGELSPSSFREFGLPYLRQISVGVKAHLREWGVEPVPMVVFAKGAWFAFEELCECGYEVVGLDWLHDLGDAAETARRKGVVVQGNLDPGVLYGSEEGIEGAVRGMCESFREGWRRREGPGERGLGVGGGGGGGGGGVGGKEEEEEEEEGDWQGWIVNLGHGVTPYVDKEKLRWFFNCVRKYTGASAERGGEREQGRERPGGVGTGRRGSSSKAELNGLKPES